MAQLYLQSLLCIQSLGRSDQVTLSFNSDPFFSWSPPDSITITSGTVVYIQEMTGDFFSDARITLSINEDSLPTPQDIRQVSAWPPIYYQSNFQVLNAQYILLYEVRGDFPIVAIVLYLLVDALALVRQFLLRVIDALKYLAGFSTRRYQQQIREQQQLRDIDRIE